MKVLALVCLLLLASCAYAQTARCDTDADCDNGNPCSVGSCNRNGFCEQDPAFGVIPGLSRFCCVEAANCPPSACQTAACNADSFQCEYTTVPECVSQEYGQTSGFGTTLTTSDLFSTSSATISAPAAAAAGIVLAALL